MSDLIERLSKHRCGDITRELIDEAMDALEAKDAEIERLRAVVDAAISAIESLDEGAPGYGHSIEGHRWPLRDELLMNLRAALETDADRQDSDRQL